MDEGEALNACGGPKLKQAQQNGLVESFNARLRDDLLNEEVFDSLGGARRTLARWRHDYNTVRPHSSLGGRTPAEARRSPELSVGSATAALANCKSISYVTDGLSI